MCLTRMYVHVNESIKEHVNLNVDVICSAFIF